VGVVILKILLPSRKSVSAIPRECVNDGAAGNLKKRNIKNNKKIKEKKIVKINCENNKICYGNAATSSRENNFTLEVEMEKKGKIICLCS